MTDVRKFWEEEQRKAGEKFDKARGKATLEKWGRRLQECRMALRDLEKRER